MSDDNKVSITIPSSSEYVGVVRLAISGIATRMNFTVEEIEDIKIAISEACTNAVQHAYPDTVGRINISSTIDNDKLTIEVSDHGVGFDTRILGSKEQREKSEKKLGLGLGLTFIKNLMDEANVQSTLGQGTTIRMMKQRPTESHV
jgi:serine/threonine-protein kinase RsbW